MMKADYDIVIIGAGLLGSALAHALGHYLPFKVALIESQAPHTMQDKRSIALAYGSAAFLAQIGISPKLVSHSTTIQKIHISERGQFGFTRLSANAAGVPALGYVILQHHLQQALAITNHPKINLLQPLKLLQMQRIENLWQLKFDNNHTIHAPFIVAADGSYSTVRLLQGINRFAKDYQQSAVIAKLQIQHPEQNTAFERFSNTGPIALLPLSYNEYSLVWCLPPEVALDIAKLNEAEFLKHLQNQFGYRLGRFLQASERCVYPLIQFYVTEQIRLGLVLLGNAAHTLHPIAGQGFNLGLRDVVELTHQLLIAQKKGASLQNFSILQAYQKARLIDQERLLTFTNGLLNSFKIDNQFLRYARNLGLLAIDQLSCLQKPLFKTTLSLQQPLEAAHG